jgi:hypothetical protein
LEGRRLCLVEEEETHSQTGASLSTPLQSNHSNTNIKPKTQPKPKSKNLNPIRNQQKNQDINEYFYRVAAPAPLPGGMAIQIVDCAGAQLSMVNAGTVAAFRVRFCPPFVFALVCVCLYRLFLRWRVV